MLQDQEIGRPSGHGLSMGSEAGFTICLIFWGFIRAGIEPAILFGVYTNELDMIPSGKHTTNYGQLQFLMEKSTN